MGREEVEKIVGGCIFFLPGSKSTKNFWNSKIFISSGAPDGAGRRPFGTGGRKNKFCHIGKVSYICTLISIMKNYIIN